MGLGPCMDDIIHTSPAWNEHNNEASTRSLFPWSHIFRFSFLYTCPGSILSSASIYMRNVASISFLHPWPQYDGILFFLCLLGNKIGT